MALRRLRRQEPPPALPHGRRPRQPQPERGAPAIHPGTHTTLLPVATTHLTAQLGLALTPFRAPCSIAMPSSLLSPHFIRFCNSYLDLFKSTTKP